LEVYDAVPVGAEDVWGGWPEVQSGQVGIVLKEWGIGRACEIMDFSLGVALAKGP
jgi:hypothetical protein